jgi:hypothetical protein
MLCPYLSVSLRLAMASQGQSLGSKSDEDCKESFQEELLSIDSSLGGPKCGEPEVSLHQPSLQEEAGEMQLSLRYF